MLYFLAMQSSLHLNLQLVCDLPGGMTSPPPKTSSAGSPKGRVVWTKVTWWILSLVKLLGEGLQTLGGQWAGWTTWTLPLAPSS